MDLLKELGNLKPMEMIDLVKRLEKRWGISSKPIIQVQELSEQIAPVEEESTLFTIKLISFVKSKIDVIKVLRKFNTKLGLIEAKKLVESAPVDILYDLDKEAAAQAKKEFEAVGATIEI